MIQVKFLGSGGQGVVIAAKLLAEVAARSKYHSQSFSSYGAERRGGRVEAYVRISEEPIVIHSKMYQPDYLIIMDECHIKGTKNLPDLNTSSAVLINSASPSKEFSHFGVPKVVTINANQIAKKHHVFLASGLPVVNTTVLGAVIGITSREFINELPNVIKEAGIPEPDKNIEAAYDAYRIVLGVETGLAATGGMGLELSTDSAYYPMFDRSKLNRCNRCLICYISCPDLAISFDMDPFLLKIDHAICKRCGICIEECPRSAISWGGAS